MSFVKKISAFVLLLAFMASTFNQASLVFGYYLNKAAYIQKCENKYRPELNCNGQCLLMKKLKQQEQNEKKFPELKLENKTEVVSYQTFFPAVLNADNGLSINYYTWSDNRTIDKSSSFFHPPGC